MSKPFIFVGMTKPKEAQLQSPTQIQIPAAKAHVT